MHQHDQPQRSPLAIVGIGALFPGSTSVAGLWRDIVAGRDLIGDIPPHYWLVDDYYSPDPAAADKTYCKRGAFLPKIDFDPMEFGIPPNLAPTTDTCQLLALWVAKQVLEEAAGGPFASIDRSRISVILGVAAGLELVGEMASRLQRPVWVKAMRESGLPEEEVQSICDRIADHYVPWTESTFPGLLGNVVAGRIANRFNLGGTNCTTDAACASSFAALSMAANELSLGESDLVITGGVDTTNDPFIYMCFSKTPALSPTGDCRPFSASADGTMLGEGVGMIALRRLADAERDGNHIYAVIRGVGASSDGRARSVYAPLPEGQARALRRAYQTAEINPATVELVEAHGTGTVAGDIAEFEGMCQVYNDCGRRDRQWCALGSIKSQYGHTKAAAGAVGLIKAALALHHKVLPPTIKVDRPDPRLKIEDSPFYLNTETRPWIRDASHPRRAAVSSFGFGGTNFHIVLEEHTGPSSPRLRPSPTQLYVVAAERAEDVVARCRALCAEESAEEGWLERVARESQERFAPASVRLAIVASDAQDLRAKAARAAETIAAHAADVLSDPSGIYYAVEVEPKAVAFLFSGQGSQYLGMGDGLLVAFDDARRIWDELCTTPLDGVSSEAAAPLHQVVFPRPVFSAEEREELSRRLTATQWAQPAIGATSLAYLAVLQRLGVCPSMVGGHSFGEITALHAAGVISAADLLRVARRRGELMAEAAAVPGAMTAVGRPPEVLRPLLAELGSDVVIANHNSPRQTVLAGTCEAIAEVERRLAERKIAARRLSVATAFHSPLVGPSSVPFAEFLRGVEVAPPRMPVYSNAEVTPYPASATEIRRLLAEQIARPVRFAEEIEAMYSAGARTFVEVGPGSILTTLVGQCLEKRPHLAVSLDRKGQHSLTSLWHALGRLTVAGVTLDLGALWRDVRPIPRPSAKPAITIAIDGANCGRLYPPAEGAAALPKPNPPRPVVAEPPPPPPPPPPNQLGSSVERRAWIEAYQEAQRQTAETHAAYQRSMAESHLAFLRASEASAQRLCAMVSGAPLSTGFASASVEPPALTPWSSPPPPVIAPAAPAPEAQPPAPALPAAGLETSSAAPPAGVEPQAAATPTLDLRALLLSVVADKTGYPPEILKLEMGLESDLGIDSIKRVEILSALQERLPAAPQVDAAEMSKLQTLGQVLAFVERCAAADGSSGGNGGSDGGNGDRVRAPSNAPVVARQVLREVAAPAAAGKAAARAGASAVVSDDGMGVAAALVARLRTRGLDARVVESVTEAADVVVLLGGLRPVNDERAAIAVNREAFRGARAIASTFTSRGGVFYTVQDTGGDFGLGGGDAARAILGGLAGLAKTAAREWPQATARAIDLERGGRSVDSLAAALEQEILGGGRELEVGLHADGRRTTLELRAEPAAPAAGAPWLAEGAFLVVSGGGRGVTAATLIELARRVHPRVALLGRTPLVDEPEHLRSLADDASLKRALLERRDHESTITPAQLAAEAQCILAAREVRSTLSALKEAGAEACYVAVDVRDLTALSAALAPLRRRWGAVAGVIHGAGVLADRMIADKTPDQFDRVFDTKVEGLRALLAATREDPLRLICLFSSVAARFGNAGQCDYAMANEVLNKMAQAEALRRGGGCRVRSINWGPWAGGMVTPALRVHFEARHVPLIPLEVGARMLVDEIEDSSSEVEVVIGAAPSAAGASFEAPQAALAAGLGSPASASPLSRALRHTRRP